MVAQLGATPVLCGLIGSESGQLLRGLLTQAIELGIAGGSPARIAGGA